MKFTIGIDVGGTNTDGVLYNTQKKSVEKSIKIPTAHQSYNICIEEALCNLVAGIDTRDIISLNISTTLSTNMLLEKKGAPVNLVLIGYEDFPHIKNEILSIVSPHSILEIRGGHTRWGKERARLDAAALQNYAEAHKRELFAVSSLFSPRNPEHEQTASRILSQAGCAGITCGHEIARSKLNSVKRTVTAFLNSSLIPITKRLISGVEKSASSVGIKCPIMFLRSDSSLVSEQWCARFPVETIFSGPAASMRGGAILGGVGGGDAVIADMGGTSTDIGVIHGGATLYSPEGAVIGDYKTMIPSLQIRSIALGGDSKVDIQQDGGIMIGPERVSPFFSYSPDSGYTPSDALCTLGLYKQDGASASVKASERYGMRIQLKPKEFAALVRKEVSIRLERFIDDVNEDTTKVVCVGAPIAAFVSDDARCFVPQKASVASAIGAASSSLSLCCTASVLHNFSDETFCAFLPAKTMTSENLSEVLEMVRSELFAYIKSQAMQMGFGCVSVQISSEDEYIGENHTQATLAAVYVTAEAVVQCAQK